MTRNSVEDYLLESLNPRVDANRRLVEYEIRPGNTVTFSSPVDLTQIENIRSAAVQAGTIRPSYTAFIAKAVALGLQEFPYANRRVCKHVWPPFVNRLQRFHHCDVAVAAERMIEGAESVAFVDILRDAERLSLAEMTEWLANLARCDETTNAQWRDFSRVTQLPWFIALPLLRLPHYFPGLWVKWRGAAALISSPAKYGVQSLVATWPWPLGFSFGYVSPRPMVNENNEIVVKICFDFVLNFDRRVMAGAPAAKFFRRIVDLLESASVSLADDAPRNN